MNKFNKILESNVNKQQELNETPTNMGNLVDYWRTMYTKPAKPAEDPNIAKFNQAWSMFYQLIVKYVCAERFINDVGRYSAIRDGDAHGNADEAEKRLVSIRKARRGEYQRAKAFFKRNSVQYKFLNDNGYMSQIDYYVDDAISNDEQVIDKEIIAFNESVHLLPDYDLTLYEQELIFGNGLESEALNINENGIDDAKERLAKASIQNSAAQLNAQRFKNGGTVSKDEEEKGKLLRAEANAQKKLLTEQIALLEDEINESKKYLLDKDFEKNTVKAASVPYWRRNLGSGIGFAAGSDVGAILGVAGGPIGILAGSLVGALIGDLIGENIGKNKDIKASLDFKKLESFVKKDSECQELAKEIKAELNEDKPDLKKLKSLKKEFASEVARVRQEMKREEKKNAKARGNYALTESFEYELESEIDYLTESTATDRLKALIERKQAEVNKLRERLRQMTANEKHNKELYKQMTNTGEARPTTTTIAEDVATTDNSGNVIGDQELLKDIKDKQNKGK